MKTPKIFSDLLCEFGGNIAAKVLPVIESGKYSGTHLIRWATHAETNEVFVCGMITNVSNVVKFPQENTINGFDFIYPDGSSGYCWDSDFYNQFSEWKQQTGLCAKSAIYILNNPNEFNRK